jgi:hypothetical protein
MATETTEYGRDVRRIERELHDGQFAPGNLQRAAAHNYTAAVFMDLWRSGRFSSFEQMATGLAIELVNQVERLMNEKQRTLAWSRYVDSENRVRAGVAQVPDPDESASRLSPHCSCFACLHERGESFANFTNAAFLTTGASLGLVSMSKPVVTPAKVEKTAPADPVPTFAELTRIRKREDGTIGALIDDPINRLWLSGPDVLAADTAAAALPEEKPYVGLNGVDPTCV